MFDPTAFFTQYQALKGVKPETWDKLSQTWPARMAQSAWNAATLPGDVWNGKVDPLSEEGIGRATDLAGLTMSSTLASPRGSIGVGPVLPKKPNPMAVEPPTPMTMTPPQGIRAYHGSPHDFDKFDISKIGTGEGAQVYGHGLYFAENEGVAKSYRDALGAGGFTADVLKEVPGLHPDQKRQLSGYITNIVNKDGVAAIADYEAPKGFEQAWNIAQNIANKRAIDNKFGRMYEVNINARPDQFLDWDKAIKDQGEVGDIINRLLDKNPDVKANLQNNKWTGGPPTGENLFGAYSETIPLAQKYSPRMSQDLLEAGIPGIRYLDQGSRGQGNGTFNYVVFNDALIDILKKYGIAGMAAAPVIAGAVNQQEPVANY